MGQLTSISEKELPCLVKKKMCNKETTAPYVTSGTQLTHRAVITWVTLSFLLLNSPAKLPKGKRGRFPEKVQNDGTECKMKKIKYTCWREGEVRGKKEEGFQSSKQ